ncbi:spore coat protein [Paenibacillus sp. 598K]|nr:spore coat protein [Paenibacillus sp. 598K]
MYNQSLLPQEDMAYTILADLKRVTREYATAATESSCPNIRNLFTHLLNSTLKMQGQLYETMKQANMYSAASPALRQEIDKQLRQNQQTQQKTAQFLHQTSHSAGYAQPAAQHHAPQQQGHNSYYM